MRATRTSMIAATLAVTVAAGIALAAKKTFDTGVFMGKDNKAAAAGLLDVAMELAGKGTWERLAVARVRYLSGDKAEGQKTIDDIVAGKVDDSDWMRIGAIYFDAGDYDKAFQAFDKAIDADPKDAEHLAKVGAFYNLRGQREHAEELFASAFERKPDEIWVTVYAAASYAGVRPQD